MPPAILHAACTDGTSTLVSSNTPDRASEQVNTVVGLATDLADDAIERLASLGFPSAALPLAADETICDATGCANSFRLMVPCPTTGTARHDLLHGAKRCISEVASHGANSDATSHRAEGHDGAKLAKRSTMSDPKGDLNVTANGTSPAASPPTSAMPAQGPRSAVAPRTRAHSCSETSCNKFAKRRALDAPSPSPSARQSLCVNDVTMRELAKDDGTAKEVSQAKRIRIAPSIARANLLAVCPANVACPSDEASATFGTPPPAPLPLSARM